ncbi:adenylate kinase [Paenibacillus sp. P26]|nr:adenylate kinase [Paenibacillus sp. P26]
MQIILIGLPGSGKGTQAERIHQAFGIPRVSTGDLFRAAMATGTRLGRKAKEYVNQGQLVPDEITVGIVRERLSDADLAGGFLLDGFPRTVFQAEQLEQALQAMNRRVDVAIDLNVNTENLLSRLAGRRICSSCGAAYHVVFHPPREQGICEKCGGALVQRADDSEETVAARLEVNLKQQQPLLQFYRSRQLLQAVDGDAGVEDVFGQISSILRGCAVSRGKSIGIYVKEFTKSVCPQGTFILK